MRYVIGVGLLAGVVGMNLHRQKAGPDPIAEIRSDYGLSADLQPKTIITTLIVPRSCRA
jgi:hypothetical protein